MGISLQKGDYVSLSKSAGLSLNKVRVDLNWGLPQNFDLDAVAFCLNWNGQVLNDEGFIFYGNKTGLDGSIQHCGDCQVGNSQGEKIEVTLKSVPPNIVRIAFCVSIHEGEILGQNFGQLSKGSVCITNLETDEIIATYDLSQDMSNESTMIFAEVYLRNEEWKFKAVGKGFHGGLGPLATSYGVNIE